MRERLLISLIILTITMCCSCNKDEDTRRPVINYLEPPENIIINLPDTIKVVAEVRDETNITVVEVSLVDDLGIPIVTGGFYYPDTSYFKVTSYLSITDKSIPGGTYNIKITASDYFNITNAYRSIILNEMPKELTGYIAVTASYPFESTVIRMNTQLIKDTSFVFPKGFLLSGLNSLWDQFYFVTPEPSVLYAFNAGDFEPLYDFPAWFPRTEFSTILTDDQLLLSTMNGDACILNSAGQIDVKTMTQPNKTIQCFTADENYMYAEMVSLSGDIREIASFYRITGAIRSQRLISDDIVALQPVHAKALIISSSVNATKISEFDPENILITELNSFSRKEVSSTLKMNDDNILIFTDEQVLLYEYDKNSLSEYLPGVYEFGRYDHLSGQLYLVKDSLVDIVSPVSAYPITITFSESVKDFHLVFNKK